MRRTHPAAFVALAPYADMGSLDDTAMARFSILQAPVASTAAPRRPVALQGPKPALLARRRGEAAAPTATVANGPAPPVRAPPVLAPPVLAPAARVPASTATPPARESAPTRAAAPEPAQSAPVAQLDTTQPPQVEAVAQAEALQKFAVQLMWTRAPIDVAQITRLKIFNGYLLYAVETEPGGSREYGVRLGFYGDALSAGLVAQYVRPAFKDAAVVPVSERELKRAAAAVIRVAPAHTRGTRARWPAAAVSLASVRAR